ncbi:MAG TPA: hypothetical protein VFN35_10375 [Ktedonobacteraceae bacterium]|nr:hypothetical protein [Ktedonobacteraceae bacterium]
MIDDLLDATAIEARTLRLHSAPFAIDALVQKVLEQQAMERMHLRLLLEETAATEIAADRERTGQVLTNLLTYTIIASSWQVSAYPGRAQAR